MNVSVKRKTIYISIIVAILFSMSYVMRTVWFDGFVRPYGSQNYIFLYFLSLWMLSLLCIKRLMMLTKMRRLVYSSLVMHIVSLLILNYGLGLIYYDDFYERLANSWRLGGWSGYFGSTILVGSFKAFMLGGWLNGLLVVILYEKMSSGSHNTSRNQGE